MPNFKELFSLKRPSIFIIILPYIFFNWIELVNSPFYKMVNFIFLLCILIIVEILFKKLINIKKYYKPISIIFLTFTFIIFYGYYSVYGYNTVSFIQKITYFHLRGRIIIPLIILFFVYIIYLINRKLNNYKILNIFFIIFSIVTAVKQISLKVNFEDINNLKNNYLRINNKSNTIKPIILIITDEYTSPDELYKVYKDSNIYNFSNKLINKGWKIKNSKYSYEISTIHSLSSLFNFNLSKNTNYKAMTISSIGINKLIHAAIYDSLINKNISIINYGILDIGESRPINRLYFYPRNFFEEFFKNTSIFQILINIGGLGKLKFENSFYPMEEHNKFILNNLKINLLEIKKKKFFTYVHLYMPHSPMQYKPEFSLLNQNLNNYYSYWNFTNKKLDALLNNLILDDNYRIILTGDHGYRGDHRINPHFTFTAFYGFEQASIDKIKSVQDLGSLINSYY